MEAVPRLPMLSFELKVSPEPTSFGPKLKQYIRDVYHEDPEMYTNEIHTLEGQRAAAVCAVRDVTGCSALKRYYCQLHFLQSRFPMAKDGAAAVSFTWRDAYCNMSCTLADIRFEMVSILYNIGALHTQLGASDSRVTADGMKLSCTHFQCAAWAFQHLKDTFPQPAGVDLAPDVMQFMYHLSLAQAQECILEKSMMDNRKATIIAKVAVQIVDYYNLALNTLEQTGSDDCTIADTVGSKVYKNWKRYVKFKIAYHSCISLLYQGQQAEEQQKMGERVAYYQAASEKLEEARKLSKGMDNIEAVNEALAFTMDVVEGKKKAAKNDNEFIYHEEVPDKDSLPEVKGASLVKGIPFNVNDPEVSGPDIFARLVPMKAHEASSLYSEEKAKLLRKVGLMIDEKDQELVTFMTSLQLDHLNLHSEPDTLPQELVDRCAALSAKTNAIQNLIDSMNKLADTYHDVEGMLQDIKELLQHEETREKEYQEIMGKRPPSIVATDLTREANKYQEAHSKASESNQTLHKAMTLHISNLRVLSLPLEELRKQIPTITSLNSPEDEAAIKEMQHLVNKVEEMRRQRAMLAGQLRESTCQDDITRQLVTRTNEPLDTIFNQEMQKHQRYVSLIEQNLAAQDNILKALTDAYARYAGTRKAANEIMRKREATINALISSYDAYEDLLAKSSKGLEFYRKLETNVSKLLQRVKSTCKVQEEEREQILAKNNKPLPRTKPTIPPDPSLPEISQSAAPKLKDYLQGMKRGGTSTTAGYAGAYPTTTIPQAPSQYYNTNIAAYGQVPPSVASPQPSNYYDQTVNATPTSQMQNETPTSQQWIPAIRPAPVGSEGTGDKTSMGVKLEPSENKTQQPYAGYMYTVGTEPPPEMKNLQSYPSAASSQLNYSAGMSAGYPNMQNQPGQVPGYNYAPQYSNGYPAGATNTVADTKAGQYPTPGAAAAQPIYQQGGGTATQYPQTNIPSATKPDMGTYYPPSTSSQSYIGTTYPNYATPQQPAMPAASYSQATVPSGYSGTQSYTGHPGYGYTASAGGYQYPSGYQSNHSVAYTTPENKTGATLPQQAYWNQPQQSAASYNMASTSSANISNTAAYYGTERLPASTSSLPSMSTSETAQQQYYSAANQQYQQYSYSYPQPQAIMSQPNISAVASTTEFQYMAATGASCYTNAGNYITSQTSSSQSTVEGHTYASQYNTQQQSYETPAYSQGSYYSLPYGYQYGMAGISASPMQSPQHGPVVQTVAVNTTANQMPLSPMTYMQARGQNADTTTTYSNQGRTSSSTDDKPAAPEKPASNVDLLAGLDFSLNQAPLVPQQPPVTTSSQKKEEQQHSKSVSSPSKQKLSTTTTTTALTATVTSTVSNVTTKTAEVIPVITTTASLSNGEQDTGSQINGEIPDAASSKSALLGIGGLHEDSKQIPKTFGKDPYMEPESLNQFVLEVEKYEKFVDGLTTKTLNGPTPLDIKWKELLELQEKDAHKRSISVARCYPMKNRFPDILPYDHSRVELPSTKDDYINASYMKNLTPLTPPFIVTQAPLPSTYTDFWTMVWEQQVEVVACLLSDAELQGQIYWPVEKGQELAMGKMKITLQSSNVRSHWVERIISVCVVESRATRVIVHLQFTSWPGSSFPASPGPFLSFVSETLNFYSQQRSASHPIVVHCLSGVGRTGLFCLIAAAICEVQAGRGLLDLVTTTAAMSTHRKGSLRDREHLKFAYQALLYYVQDLLMKRGILTSRSTFEDKRNRGGKSHTRHPSEDFLLGPPTDLSQLQSGIEKMGLGAASSIDKKRRGSTSSIGKLSHSSSENIGDPLSELDPLWPLKRL